MYKLSNIDVSLSRGKLYGKKQIMVGVVAVIIAILMTIEGSILVIISCLEFDGKIFVVAVGSAIIGVAFLSVLIYCFKKDIKIKKEVSLWLEDAIKCDAISKQIDSYRAGFQPICTKIGVRFLIDEIVYERESTVKLFAGKKGYSGVFNKYVNRPIQILYSPTYDEVLILKN